MRTSCLIGSAALALLAATAAAQEPALEAPVLIVGSGGRAAMYRFQHGDEPAWVRLGPTPAALNWNEFYSTYVPPWKAPLPRPSREALRRQHATAAPHQMSARSAGTTGCLALGCLRPVTRTFSTWSPRESVGLV